MDNFERASRIGLTFDTPVGTLTDRDMWHLPLTGTTLNLNDIAKAVNKVVKDQDDEDFVSVKKSNDTLPQLRLDIVKRIIEYKLAAQESNEKRQKTVQKNERIKNILANKEDEELQGKTAEELQELLEE
jgi:phosphomevalonate kinase